MPFRYVKEIPHGAFVQRALKYVKQFLFRSLAYKQTCRSGLEVQWFQDRKSQTGYRAMYGYENLRSKELGKDGDIDLESGSGDKLFPGISYSENQLRWGLIRKVYGILTAQLLLTTLVSVAVVFYAPLSNLLQGSSGLLSLFSISSLIRKIFVFALDLFR